MRNRRSTILVIIPCFNRPKPLEMCLKSLKVQSSKEFEVIVIDDCSDKLQSCQMASVVQKFSDFTSYVRSDIRLGLPSARNLGLARRRGYELILFLDDDCRTDKSLISDLIEMHKKTTDKSIKVFVPRLILARDIYLHPNHGIAEFGRLSKDVYCNFDSSEENDVRILFGHACSCFRAEVFNQMQFDSKAFKMNFIREETDLFLRINKAGWYAIFCPSIIIYHDNIYPNSGCKIGIFHNEIATLRNQAVFVNRYFSLTAFTSMLFFTFVRGIKIVSFAIPRLGFGLRKTLALLKI